MKLSYGKFALVKILEGTLPLGMYYAKCLKCYTEYQQPFICIVETNKQSAALRCVTAQRQWKKQSHVFAIA